VNNGQKIDKSVLENYDDWYIPTDLLSIEVLDPDDDPEEDIKDYDIKWSQFLTPSEQAKETDQEAKERKQAIQEQVDAGILKLSTPDLNQLLDTPLLNDGRLNPHLAKMVRENTIKKRFEKKVNSKGKEVVLPNRMSKSRQKKIGPNDPCPCGSGKKFKKCHGRGKGFIKLK